MMWMFVFLPEEYNGKGGAQSCVPVSSTGSNTWVNDAVQGGRGHRTLPKLPARPIMTRDRFFVHEI
jgi:hypothetical protein